MQEIPNPELDNDFIQRVNDDREGFNLQSDELDQISTNKGLKIAHI